MLNRIVFYKPILRILFLSFILGIINCSPPSYNNACELGSKTFVNNFIITTVGLKRDSYCGIVNSATAAANAAAANGGLAMTGFSFTDAANGLSKTYTGTITGTNIAIDIPYGKLTTAIPTISTNAAVIQAGTATVVSGVTVLDFTNPVTFTLISSNGSKLVYTVTAYAITPVADTGQTNCFNYGTWVASCSSVSASFPNQDGELQNFPNAKGVQPPATNSAYPNDPINRDILKGIVWKTCHEGQTGLTCAGAATGLNHASATTACNNLNTVNSGAGYAGLKNWRLPTIQELNQLMEFNGSTNNTNYWNPSLFPNPPPSNAAPYAWSSSLLLPAGTSAMSHNDQYVTNTATSTSNRAHCVNGITPPAFDMVDNGDGTILDKRTKLIWQKCALGQANDASCTGTPSLQNWSNSLLGCKNLALAGKAWRLPNVNEMVTLFDLTLTTTQKVNSTLFPNFTAATQYYDTSTGNQQNLAYTQMLTPSSPSFQGVSGRGAGTNYNARCVAGPE